MQYLFTIPLNHISYMIENTTLREFNSFVFFFFFLFNEAIMVLFFTKEEEEFEF